MTKWSSKSVLLQVDSSGWILVDGVKIGKLIIVDGQNAIQVCDKDNRRSSERGTRFVQVSVKQLINLANEAPKSENE